MFPIAMASNHEHIQIQVSGDVVVVRPAGELDLATAPALRAALEAAATLGLARVMVVLTDVTFLDSTGLGAIVHGWRFAADGGVSLTLSDPSPSVQRVLTITGLDRLLEPD
jgi:anti-sigma B factor antagonist